MIKRVRFRSVTRIDRNSPYRLEATWTHRVSIGLNASQSARNASRLSYSPEVINSSAYPHSSGVGRGTDIESPGIHRHPLQPAARTDVESQPTVQAYLHQRQSPIGGFLPNTSKCEAFSPTSFAKSAKNFLSIIFLSFISVYPLNFNKPGWIKSVHLMFILKNISHLVADYTGPANHSVDVGMRMRVDPSIDPAVCYQFSVFTGKGAIQHGTPYGVEPLPGVSADGV